MGAFTDGVVVKCVVCRVRFPRVCQHDEQSEQRAEVEVACHALGSNGEANRRIFAPVFDASRSPATAKGGHAPLLR